MLLEIGDIRVALEKPQKLVHDRFEVQLLGRDQRKALRKIEAHLPAEDGERSGPRPVALGNAVFENVPEKVEIGAHGPGLANPCESEAILPAFA
jgi:hypothetical protein